MLTLDPVQSVLLPCSVLCSLNLSHAKEVSQWGAADAEIKSPSGENAEPKFSPFRAWGRSVQPYKLRLLPGISSSLIALM